KEDAARLLLEHGAQVDAVAKNPMSVMPLHSAAAGHSLAVVQALLEHGAAPNAKQQQGWTALHEAAQRGDNEMIALLLRHGADPTVKTDEGVRPVQLARENGHVGIARPRLAWRDEETYEPDYENPFGSGSDSAARYTRCRPGRRHWRPACHCEGPAGQCRDQCHRDGARTSQSLRAIDHRECRRRIPAAV